MPKRSPDSSYADNSVAQQLRDAVNSRLKALKFTLGNVANGIGRDESTLRAWLRGANRVAFEDVLALDAYFSDLGHDGLLEELRPHPPRGYWRAEEESLETIGAVNIDAVEDCTRLQELGNGHSSPYSPLSLLATAGLLEKCMLYFRLDVGIYAVHLGRHCPSPFNEFCMGQDVRRHADPGLGNALHRQLLAQASASERRPRLLRLISPHGSCLLFSLPLNESFVVSLPLPPVLHET